MTRVPSHIQQYRARRAAAVLLAIAILGSPGVARATVMDNDLVGGKPVGKTAVRRSQAPNLYIPSGMLVTADGRELWSRDPRQRRAMASTTKIMTALVVFEQARLDDTVSVSRTAARKVGESGMGLITGERFTVRELLEGLMIQSGNDASVALAEHVAGSVPAFVRLMNDRARALDLVNTHFKNPHGLDQKGHYTTAEDLTALSRYAMRIPEFRSMARTYRKRVHSDRYTHTLTSHNLLLKKLRGANGIKTGWTDDAGYCIVASAERDGVELIATVLGAASEGSRLGQVRRLLEWGFRHYRSHVVVSKEEAMGTVPVSDWLDVSVTAVAAESTSVPVFDLAGPVRRKVKLVPEVGAPVTAGQRLGTIVVYQGDTLLAQVPAIASRDVAAPTFGERIGIFFTRAWRGIFGA